MTPGDVETDVLIAGAGGTGLAAALSAREHGVRVTVLEKESEVGGATAMSGGSILGSDTPAQREAGIQDEPAALAEDILNHANAEVNQTVVATLARESAETIDWLERALGVSLSVNTGPYGRHGHRVPRRHWIEADEGIHRSGEPLVAKLLSAARDRRVEVLTDHPARDLVIEHGRVVGVAAGKDRVERIGAGAVILATGGFGNDPDARRRHLPGAERLLYYGDEGSTGDGIRMGKMAGGSTEHLSAFLGFPTISRPEGVFVPWETTKEGALIVDGSGRRFADAGARAYSEFAGEIVAHGADAVFLVSDAVVDEAMATQPSTADRWANCRDHDVFASAETPAELARALGVDPEGLAASTEAVEAVESPGGTAPDGHSRQVARALEPPFYGTEISPAVLQTQGGLVVDERARVLDADAEPVPGLYAGGGAAVGLSGSQPEGYLSGSGLLAALNLGRIAGRHAANAIPTA